jgi:hypothetical protein
VAAQHSTQFTVDCVKQIHHDCSMPMKDMRNVRLCLECAWGYPLQLDMEQPTHNNMLEVVEELANAQAAVTDA